jgi:hypothetical protein
MNSSSSSKAANLVTQLQVALQTLLEACPTFPEHQQTHIKGLNYHFAVGPLAPVKAPIQPFIQPSSMPPSPSVPEKLATTSTTTPSGKKGVSKSKAANSSTPAISAASAKSVEQFRQDLADNKAAADSVMAPLTVVPTTTTTVVPTTTTKPSISDSDFSKKRSHAAAKEQSSVKRVKTLTHDIYDPSDDDEGQGVSTDQRSSPLPVEDDNNDDDDPAFKLKEEQEMQRMRDLASKVTAAREAQELAAKELAAKELAAKELAAKEQAAKDKEAKDRAKQVKQDALKEMLRRQEEDRQRQEEERLRLLAEMAAIDNDNDD